MPPREHDRDPGTEVPGEHFDRRLARFEEGLRRWAARPAPPPPLALETSTRTARRAAVPRWRWVAASLAVAAAVVAGLLLHSRSVRPPAAPAAAPMSPPAETAVAALASRDEVLVLWLDAETPLYLTLPAVTEAANVERSNR